MPLESLQPDARLDVRSAAIETVKKKPETFFDVDRDVDDEEIEHLKLKMQEYKNGENWRFFLPMAANFVILFPDKREEIGIDDDLWEVLKDEAKLPQGLDSIDDISRIFESEAEKEQNWEDIHKYLNRALYLKILFPEKFHEFDFRGELIKGLLEMDLENKNNQDKDIQEYIELFRAKILEPDWFESKKGEYKLWPRVKKGLDVSSNQDKEWPQFYLKDLALAKLGFQKEFPELEIDDEVKKLFVKTVKDLYGGKLKVKFHEEEYLEHIMYLQVLAAKKIHFTPKGIVMEMPSGEVVVERKIPPVPKIKE